MKLHVACARERDGLGEILYLACVRSFSRSQVERSALPGLRTVDARLVLIAEPTDDSEPQIRAILGRRGAKLALFGALAPRVASQLGIVDGLVRPELKDAADCPPAPVGGSSESALRIRYADHGLGAMSPIRERPFLRYDYGAEWNNLGFGAIRNDGSVWSLAQVAHAPKGSSFAEVTAGGKRICTFAAVFDFPEASVLWINRPVGTVDSAEWRIVETFFGDYRPADLDCLPRISEIPAGCDAAVTMRLDCDEDVASAQPLIGLYRALGVPISLAIRTDQLADPRHQATVREVFAAGGSILSHSHTHPANWGADFEEAQREATLSREALAALVGKEHVSYAVSPFHRTPGYAVLALAVSGYRGFVGGIVASDPQYLVGRGGEVPGAPPGFVTHSQQCMLHGDCLPAGGDALRVYRQSFAIARAARSIFGYLDHPFSQRYQYGWKSEEDRLRFHEALIVSMRSAGRVRFLSENEALDFVRARAAARIQRKGAGGVVVEPPDGRFVVEYRGTLRRVADLHP